jgi:hypothetical protein
MALLTLVKSSSSRVSMAVVPQSPVSTSSHSSVPAVIHQYQQSPVRVPAVTRQYQHSPVSTSSAMHLVARANKNSLRVMGAVVPWPTPPRISPPCGVGHGASPQPRTNKLITRQCTNHMRMKDQLRINQELIRKSQNHSFSRLLAGHRPQGPAPAQPCTASQALSDTLPHSQHNIQKYPPPK